jgi:hypothetical protein
VLTTPGCKELGLGTMWLHCFEPEGLVFPAQFLGMQDVAQFRVAVCDPGRHHPPGCVGIPIEVQVLKVQVGIFVCH